MAIFWDAFESSLHGNPKLSDIDRFNYLHSLLEGSAADSIVGLSFTSVKYGEAIAVLKRFGNKQQIVSTRMDQLLALEAVTSLHDQKGLHHLYDRMEANVRSPKALGVLSESNGSLLSLVLMKRSPQELCIIVSRQVGDDCWNFEVMMQIVEKEIQAR